MSRTLSSFCAYINPLLRFVFFSPRLEAVEPADAGSPVANCGLFSPHPRAEEKKPQQEVKVTDERG